MFSILRVSSEWRTLRCGVGGVSDVSFFRTNIEGNGCLSLVGGSYDDSYVFHDYDYSEPFALLFHHTNSRMDLSGYSSLGTRL